MRKDFYLKPKPKKNMLNVTEEDAKNAVRVQIIWKVQALQKAKAELLAALENEEVKAAFAGDTDAVKKALNS